MTPATPALSVSTAQKECKLSQVVFAPNSPEELNKIRAPQARGTQTAPGISRIWYDQIFHPAGASRSAAVIHTYIDWTDGAQTSRAGWSGGWLCVHPGAGWPDALETCAHIAALTGGAE